MNFWHDLPRPFFILAPMEAVTDVVFRHVVKKSGSPDVFFTEFTNATGWVHAGDKAIGGRLVKTDDENPIVAQLWGGVPSDIAQLSQHCKTLGFHGIDINMGCPDASAVKAGGGAGMILNPELAAEMIEAAKTAGLPVSVKTRLGYSTIDEWKVWLAHLLRQDIVNLTIHLRTKREMSKVPAHYELIPDIIALRDEIAPRTLLTINGDIENRAEGLGLVEKYPGINGVMIGRGIFHDPFCFTTPNDENARTPATRAELLELLYYHLDLHDEWDSSEHPRKFDPLKRFFKVYVHSFEGAAELRDKLMHTKNTAQVRAVLSNWHND